MNKISLQIYFMVFLHFTGLLILNGQQYQSKITNEKVILFSDRTLYITGEQILFSAFLQSEVEMNQAEMSRVLYCELIAPDGNKITGNKYLIKNSSAFGYLVIPKDIITGIYYLRAYTKFMRNSGPLYYNYTSIKIVNPKRNEVQAIKDNNYLSEGLPGDDNPEKTRDSFLISPEKSQYAPRDTVHITIDGIETNQSSWKGLSLAVVPEFSISANKVELSENRQFEKRVFYYPESRGLSITGKLTDSATGYPLPFKRVNLSILGRGRDFMAIQTDTAGRFFFSLPDYTGNRDLFLSAENTSTSTPKILIDNDYCSLPVNILHNVFTLTKQEREVAYKMAVNVQLKSYFNEDSISDTQNNQDQDQVFYGKPTEILYIDNYIQLPTLEEYFNELVTLVKVRKRQGEKYFRVLGTQSGLIDFDPLILVDLVAIDDPSKVLAISPTNISRIDVVNTLYIKGDQTYGGIINIITKNGDFGGIDLPSSGVFINYGFLADNSHYPGIYPLPIHCPDSRNTLYWEPQLRLNKNNSSKVSFTVSDTPGKYLIVLNGINSKGKTFRQASTIEVIK
jgi:hypothetical protein